MVGLAGCAGAGDVGELAGVVGGDGQHAAVAEGLVGVVAVEGWRVSLGTLRAAVARG